MQGALASPTAYAADTDMICQARCPDPMFSGSAKAAAPEPRTDPQPRILSGVFTSSDTGPSACLPHVGAMIVESDGTKNGSLRGRTLARHPGTTSAAYTSDGELALLTTNGKLRRPARQR